MGELLLGVGLLLMCAAVGISNFFIKFILWAGACVALYYGLDGVDLLDAEKPIASALFFIGLFQIALSTFVIKFLGIEIARGVSDVIIHTLGIIMIIAGGVLSLAS